MRPRVRSFALALGLACVPATSRAAQDPGWSLRWRAPPECPTEQVVRERVAALLAGSAPPATPMRFTAAVRRDRSGWALDLQARHADGEQRRRVVHTDCAVLGEAGALIVAMAIDPAAIGAADSRVLSLLRPATGVQPTSRAIAAPKPPAASAPADAAVQPVSRSIAEPKPSAADAQVPDAPAQPDARVPEASTREPDAQVPEAPAQPVEMVEPGPPAKSWTRWFGVRLMAGAGGGPLPGVHGVFAGAVTVALARRARLELHGGAWTQTQQRLAMDREAGIDLTLVTGGLRGCGAPGRGKIEFPLCGGVELGSMRGTGVGLARATSERSLWAAAVVGAALVITPLPRFALWIGLDAHVALARPRFQIGGVGEVWRAGAVGVRGFLGVEIRLSRGS